MLDTEIKKLQRSVSRAKSANYFFWFYSICKTLLLVYIISLILLVCYPVENIKHDNDKYYYETLDGFIVQNKNTLIKWSFDDVAGFCYGTNKVDVYIWVPFTYPFEFVLGFFCTFFLSVVFVMTYAITSYGLFDDEDGFGVFPNSIQVGIFYLVWFIINVVCLLLLIWDLDPFEKKIYWNTRSITCKILIEIFLFLDTVLCWYLTVFVKQIVEAKYNSLIDTRGPREIIFERVDPVANIESVAEVVSEVVDEYSCESTQCAEISYENNPNVSTLNCRTISVDGTEIWAETGTKPVINTRHVPNNLKRRSRLYHKIIGLIK